MPGVRARTGRRGSREAVPPSAIPLRRAASGAAGRSPLLGESAGETSREPVQRPTAELIPDHPQRGCFRVVAGMLGKRQRAAARCSASRLSGAASRPDHGIDAAAGHRPRTVIGDDQLPPTRIEGGERGLERDLHLPGRGRRRSGGRVDRAMANQEQVPPRVDPVATSASPSPRPIRPTGYRGRPMRVVAVVEASRSQDRPRPTRCVAISGSTASADDRAWPGPSRRGDPRCLPSARGEPERVGPVAAAASRGRPGRRSPTSAVRGAFGGRCARRPRARAGSR